MPIPKEQCKCCNIIDTLFQINGKAVCGACYEEIKQRRDDETGIALRKARAVKEAREINAGFVAYENVIDQLRKIRRGAA